MRNIDILSSYFLVQMIMFNKKVFYSFPLKKREKLRISTNLIIFPPRLVWAILYSTILYSNRADLSTCRLIKIVADQRKIEDINVLTYFSNSVICSSEEL